MNVLMDLIETSCEGQYSGTSQIHTSRMRLPPQYDRFFIDGFFFLLCLSKSYLPNKITSQTRYTMMKIERNTIGRNFLSEKKIVFKG